MVNRQRIGDVAEALLEYVENKETFQTAKVMTVSAASFTDPDQWRAEIELIFKRVPLMLALSCEMPKPHDYKAMEVVGLPVLISRDTAGVVRAFLNVCAHRCAPVAAEGYGSCKRFTCPFHGWTYAANGKLIAIADQAKFGDINKSTHGLKELPCEERHGMIFVCLTPGTPFDLDSYYGALLEEYADSGLKDWAFLGSGVYECANWKVSMSNFFESYHFATLHAKSVALQLVSNVIHFEGFGPNMRIGLSQPSITKLHEVPRAQWGEQENRGFIFMRYFFPNVTGYVVPPEEVSQFTQTFPGPTPDKSRIVFLYARKEPPKDQVERESIAKENKRGEEIIRDEDLAIGIQTQRALASGAHAGLLYGRNERGNQYFHEWVNWYLQDDPALPKPVL
jgi:phenylpropionate dioxygenase-like ring-hydroxylating dioxygenase large terminal subunit